MEKERQVDVKKLWDSLEDLVIKTVISGESAISYMCSTHLNNRYNSYELLGFDVLFDEYLKPWILEVLLNKSIDISSCMQLCIILTFLGQYISFTTHVFVTGLSSQRKIN